MDEGLDRYEAIHAIGLVLTEFMQDLLQAPQSDTDPNVPYFAALERLTADDWRRSGALRRQDWPERLGGYLDQTGRFWAG